MKGFLTLLTGICTLSGLTGSACADDADLYAVQFSEDSKYLITGGSGGRIIQFDANYTGGIKIPDSPRIAVACAGGLIKVFDAVTYKPLWEECNIGYRREELDKRLIQTRATGSGLERPLFSIAHSQ